VLIAILNIQREIKIEGFDKMKKFFLLLFLFHSVSHGAIRILNCQTNPDIPGEELKYQDSATAKKWKDRTQLVLDKTLDCLPKKWKEGIVNYAKLKYITIQLICDSYNEKCGEAYLEDGRPIKKPIERLDYIPIPIYYDEQYLGCGCPHSTILHELIHLGAKVGDTRDDDRQIRGCEKKCTRIFNKCIKFPPPGEECNCPK
jgi:hypothetical protein